MSDPVRSKRARGLSLVLIAIIALTSLAATTEISSAQTGASSTYTVNWQKETPKKTSNWTYRDTQWIYGPTLTMNVAYLDGTPLINATGGLPTNYLQPGRQFYVNITVPKSILELGRNLSAIMFDFYKIQYSQSGTQSIRLWQAEIGMQYSTGTPGQWLFWSFFYNYTGVGGGGNPPAQPTKWFIQNQTGCRYVETSDYYNVRFQGKMNESIPAIGGTYTAYCSMADNKGCSIIGRVYRQIVLIKPDPIGYGYGGEYLYCNCYAADMTGKKTDSVTINKPFKVVAEAGGDTSKYKNISIFLNPPVDSTFWHNWDNNSRHLLSGKAKTIKGWFYNTTTEAWQFGSYDRWASRLIRLTWNSSNLISIDEGYLWWNFTAPGDYSRWFELDYTGGSYFYSLNNTASDNDLSDGKIAFVVKIPTSANASAGTYYGDFDSWSVSGSRIYGSFPGFKILGDNVVVVELLKESSNDQAFIITPGKFFRGAMEITATPFFRNALIHQTTNITFSFWSPSVSKSWTQGDVSYWNSSHLTFYITLNTWDHNKTIVDVFNCTDGSWYNKVTYASGSSSSKVWVPDWWNYVETSNQKNYTMSYNATKNILLVALNFTFKPGVPEGSYWWDAYLCNKTYYTPSYYVYDPFEYLADTRLHYTRILLPETMGGGSYITVGSFAGYWSVWGAKQTWNTDNNLRALDLDGNNATTYDQFYVKRILTSTSYWTQRGDRMTVNLTWGQYNMSSQFALMNYTWRYEWNETYIWYYPNNMSKVPQTRFTTQINNTIWDTTDNTVRPEYSQIGQYCINMTWAKIKAQYSAYPWWHESYSWNWLEIGFNQNFWTPTQSGGSSNNLFFQYAGMLLFNDTNNDGVLNVGFTGGSAVAEELTHYFMFENAKGISFTMPGVGASGTRTVSVNESVTWGVSVNNLNGTTYPTRVTGQALAGLGWWWRDCYLVYPPEGNFSTVPSKVGIGNLNFTAHFLIPHANLTAGALNEVRVKIDEGVGPWTLYDQPQIALRNYSMAIAFVVSSSISQYSFETRNGTAVSSDETSRSSDIYNITSDTVKLANIQMGGANYTWGKDGEDYAMHSSTTPMSAFQRMYSSYSMTGSGSASISSFSVMGTNYFMTSSFKRWDGYSVRSDPYFAVYTSYGAAGVGGFPVWIIVVAVVAVVVVVVVVAAVKKKQHAK